MKKWILLFGALLFCIPYSAQALQSVPPVNQVVFFGDSLTDNGNLYKTFLKKIPKSPPYYEGRFANGPAWSDNLTQYFLVKHNIPSLNYAVGGATVILRNPFSGFLPYNLSEEINHYLISHLFSKKDQTLFIVWIGANDYLGGQPNVEQETTTVTNEIKSKIETLIKSGAKHFLILNLPDLAKTPRAELVPDKQNLHDLTLAHNVKLGNVLLQLQSSHPDVTLKLFDTYATFDDMIQNTDKYNQKFHLHIKNVAESCWTGGYTLQKEDISRLSNELNSTLIANNSTATATKTAEAILHSPTLFEAYKVNQAYESGIVPCENPDDYLFWDQVHPTTITHQIISDTLIELFFTETDKSILA
jgi:phospholipase/lecithinase/hemolysin